MEVFREIAGYEGRYQIGSRGTLWSELAKKPLRPNTDKYGYQYYVLCVNGERKTEKAHRLVAAAFLPNENALPSVNHKDENKANVPYELVKPQKWKKEFSVTADKNTSIEVCKRLFPGVNLIPPGCRKDHDGCAEACLLALYAKRRM